MNSRVLHLDLQSGISGDMFVAAAAALAGCEAEIEKLPVQLGLADVHVAFSEVTRATLRCRKFDVIESGRTEAQPEPHLGSTVSATSPDPVRTLSRPGPHSVPTQAAHSPDMDHWQIDDAHPAHRPLSEILRLIDASPLEAAVKERARRMFRRLGEIEADAHGIPLEQVHFHEVGAIDSILDLVASALCIERLQLAEVFATPVCVGFGSVRAAHGSLPVPAPATEKLLRGVPTFAGELSGEWTTPTGALILDELKPRFADAVVTFSASAFGAGNKDTTARPNALRLRLGERAPASAATAGLLRDELVAIACNLDDTTGELLGSDFLEQVLAAGARDAVLHPIVMKKGRPAHQLEVLAPRERAEAIAALLLAHTSSIGVRMIPVSRLMLPRETVSLATAFGEIAAKRVRLPDGSTRTTPEYESCRAAAAKTGVPVQTVYQAALAAAHAR